MLNGNKNARSNERQSLTGIDINMKLRPPNLSELTPKTTKKKVGCYGITQLGLTHYSSEAFKYGKTIHCNLVNHSAFNIMIFR